LLSQLFESDEETQHWVLEQFWRGLAMERREQFENFLSEIDGESVETTSILGEQARSRILDSADLAVIQKVSLAALILAEDYELEIFMGSQITRLLGDMASPVKNVTAALNGLITKGEVEVPRQSGLGQTGHKRYHLTELGLSSARELARSRAFEV
jgi:hypothetical protein